MTLRPACVRAITWLALAAMCSVEADAPRFAVIAAADDSPPKLSSKVPRARTSRYANIVDARDWRNPILTATETGIELRLNGAARDGVIVQAERLADALVGLPTAAWPYGRVVLASNPGLVNDPPDLAAIERSHAAIDRVCKRLKIRVEWWPSA